MIRHLVLLGLGPGHLRLLQELLKKRPGDVAISLISRQKRYVSDAAVLQVVAGRVAAADGGVLLEPLLRAATVRQLHHQVQAIDPAAKVLLLDDGRELRFDWLSLEPEPAQNRDATELALPGARANGLFTRPCEAFCTLWPRVAELATERPLSVAVICGGPGVSHVDPGGTPTVEVTAPLPLENADTAPASAATPSSRPEAIHWADEKFAIELAFAVRRALAGSAVTFITGGRPVAEGCHPALQNCLQVALKERRITVLIDAAKSIQSGEVVLQSGARLSCDVPLLALSAAPPAWLASSGLARDVTGQVSVDATNRSTSHPHVLAHAPRQTADQTAHQTQCQTQGQTPSWARAPAYPSAASARRLAASLCALMDNQAPAASRALRQPHALAPSQWIDTADGQMVLGWRGWAWQSWVAGLARR